MPVRIARKPLNQFLLLCALLMLWMWLGRGLFLFFNLSLFRGASFQEILLSNWYGLKLDLSAMAYLMLPILLGAAWPVYSGKRYPLAIKALRIYLIFIACVLCLLNLTDAELYRNWGTRINQQFIKYLRHPAEAAAAAGATPVGKILLFALGYLALALLLMRLVLRGTWFNGPGWYRPPQRILLSLLMLTTVITALRGGWGTIPLNQSSAWFSRNNAINNLSLNRFWNLFDNLLSKAGEVDAAKYRAGTPSAAKAAFAGEFEAPDSNGAQWIRSGKPNVVIILLESFSADVVNGLTKTGRYTPNLNRLKDSGLWFTNFYASGDRTDKGLSAVLSGFPALPVSSIVTEPQKAVRLPSLAGELARQGYRTAFYYGGNASFANMKAYLLASGYASLTDGSAFPDNEKNSKWGAHDGFLFQRVLKESRQWKEPFFSTILTLSSHEPFSVPYRGQVPAGEKEPAFRNSVLYADSCLGAFMDQARQQPWYRNTLFVLVADHGRRTGVEWPDYWHPGIFHIACLFTGGAVLPEMRGKTYESVASQTDIASTLLRQMNLPDTAFPWSRNLASPEYRPSAYYWFYDGMGHVDAQTQWVWSNDSKRLNWSQPKKNGSSDSSLKKALLIQQQLVDTYLHY